MIAPLLGYFFCMVTVLTAFAVLLTGFVNISSSRQGSLHLRPPAIGRTVMVETQRHSSVAKEETPAKDVSPVIATAKRTLKKASITSQKWLRVSATTTATEPHWVTPKNLDTPQEVLFFNEPAHGSRINFSY